MEMQLPTWVQDCMSALEQAGYAAFAVGGCVRDACLLKIPHDYDLCTDALPEETEQVFQNRRLVLAGVKHGTVGVITEGGPVEITTFRSEGTYGDNRHPDWVSFVPSVEEDLSRRDFTINAMAWSPSRGFADPFGGREDLKNGILRAVGEPDRRFREDALRILRGIRFAVRFHLQVEEKTMEAMFHQAPLIRSLARERVFEELCQVLLLTDEKAMQRFAPILSEAIGELGPIVGFDQHTRYHAYDLYTHTALVVSQVPADLTLRWAALLHDMGKIPTFTLDDQGQGHFYGHDRVGAEIGDRVLRSLKAPGVLRDQAVTLIAFHMKPLPLEKKQLRRRISRLGWEMTEKLFALQKADLCSKGADVREGLQQFAVLQSMMEALRQEDACFRLSDLSVDGHDLMALGLQGKEIGSCLQFLLEKVQDEVLPNEREALLAEAKKQFCRE